MDERKIRLLSAKKQQKSRQQPSSVAFYNRAKEQLLEKTSFSATKRSDPSMLFNKTMTNFDPQQRFLNQSDFNKTSYDPFQRNKDAVQIHYRKSQSQLGGTPKQRQRSTSNNSTHNSISSSNVLTGMMLSRTAKKTPTKYEV